MPQDSDFESKPPQRKNKTSTSETTISKKINVSSLKLVISNPPLAQEHRPLFKPAVSKSEFAVGIEKKSFDLYEMTLLDPPHDLECELTLEIEGNLGQAASRNVICHFPAILMQEGNKLMREEELLYGLVMVQFQMKILEQLLLFCTKHNASHLVIYMDDDQVEGFGIYQDFLVHQDPTLTKNGEQTEMIIPANKETIDDWMNFMAATTLSFEQELWREQRSNAVIRQYLKSRQEKETVH
jgi:hypothetical protein